MLHESVTPSGISIAFEDGAKDPETGKGKKRKYLVDGEECVSVTTALGCLDKPGLQFAAEKIAVEGCIELASTDGLPANPDGALSALKARELRFWQKWRKKGSRGTETHDELARLTAGEVGPFEVSEAAMPYVAGLREWLALESPGTLQSEVMVASVKFGVAGRFDWLGVIPRVHPTSRVRLDLKTVDLLPRFKDGTIKPPYPENLAQLAGYEICARESGYPASDFQAVLRVDRDGQFDLYVTVVDERFFLHILGCYRALHGLKALKRVEALEAAA